MKRNYLINLFIIFLCSIFTNAVSEEAHVHGDVDLNIVKENYILEITLISPAVNIVGFEHLVSNAKERLVVEKANLLLAQHEKMFSFHNDSCRHLETSMTQSGPAEKNRSELSHDGHQHEHDKNVHSEFEILYRYRCVKEVASLSVNLKDHFPGIYQINARWIKDGAQGGTILNTAKRKIIF